MTYSTQDTEATNTAQTTDTPESMEGVEFAFIIKKLEDGNLAIATAHGDPALDDVYTTLVLVKRNIEIQQTVQTFQTSMAQMAQVARTQAGGATRTEGGIVLPGDIR